MKPSTQQKAAFFELSLKKDMDAIPYLYPIPGLYYTVQKDSRHGTGWDEMTIPNISNLIDPGEFWHQPKQPFQKHGEDCLYEPPKISWCLGVLGVPNSDLQTPGMTGGWLGDV